MLFDETTSTLLCGELFTHFGDGPPLTSGDIVEPVMAGEFSLRASSLAPDTASVMRKLGDLGPTTLALMHGSSYSGDGKQALHDLAGAYEERCLTPS